MVLSPNNRWWLSLIPERSSLYWSRNLNNQARSQDLEKGGPFWKSEKCANDLDPNFHCSWISFTRFVRKLRRNFSESSEIQSYFPPKIRWSPKKKKKKRSSPKLRLIIRPKSEIQTFFPPKIRWSPKKKVFTEIETDFSAEIGNPNVSGGAVFNFSQNIGLKTTKNVRFCILHNPMGEARAPPAPPPGYATVYNTVELTETAKM